MAVPMLVERFLIAIHEIPEYVPTINVDHHKHLVFHLIGTDESETIRSIGIENSPDLQRIAHRLDCKLRETLPGVRPFLNDGKGVAA